MLVNGQETEGVNAAKSRLATLKAELVKAGEPECHRIQGQIQALEDQIRTYGWDCWERVG